MTATQLKSKIDAVLVAYPSSVYVTANEGIIYVFTDGVTKPAADADIRINMVTGKMWLLEGVTV